MEPSGLYRVVGTLVVGVATVWSASLLAQGWTRAHGGDEMIRVTGSARMNMRSDLGIWDCNVTSEGPTVAAAYGPLKSSAAQVVAYLKSKGFKDSEISTQAITSQPLYEQVAKGQQEDQNTFRKIVAYNLAETVEVRSDNVDLIAKTNGSITDLLAGGVSFQSAAPEYLFTKVSEAKVKILGAAAKDARDRASEIVANSGAKLGAVRFARMSPLQITSQDSMDISGEGQNDTTSLNKAITAIVQMGFAVN